MVGNSQSARASGSRSQLLQHDVALSFDLLRFEERMAEHVGDDVGEAMQRFSGALGVVRDLLGVRVSVVDRPEGVDLATDDERAGSPGCALEEEVFEEVGKPGGFAGLVA